MKKYLSRLLITVITVLLCFGAMKNNAFAEDMDLQRESSLKIVYKQDNVAFEGMEVEIYRVASVKEGYSFALEAPFNNYRVNLNDIKTQEEWRTAATTLSSYAVADELTPTAKQTTNAEGIVEFKNLRPGMYMTMAVYKNMGTQIVIFENFLTVIPYPSDDGEGYIYDMTVYPKHRVVEPKDGTIQYKVVKQWKDDGVSKYRTKEVTIELYKNGAFERTVTLSDENNWTYIWRTENDGAEWRVVERNVPKGYYVEIAEEDTTFIVTNTLDEDNPPGENPPKTGDTNSIELFCILACLSGLVIMLLAFSRKKKEQ